LTQPFYCLAILVELCFGNAAYLLLGNEGREKKAKLLCS
jgi:hypothetical protein